ncbi:alpha/beta hydrolase-fold protein [Cuniculiplasma divulgatum]|uniref:Putative esterase n=1 Tax=Cuniculiplasma divulgatum TaxID=1673428 RepID=A0A1R4A733_9ARCH|nr:alpha/beta hydrolase-fold protein [Cuniculiplasma divulgatum]SJK84787.1 putative esterase [Cuniculiplasma divulgatum]
MTMKVVEDEIEAVSLKNNYLNDPWKRKITIIEHNVNDTTPILIGLAGFYGSSSSFFNRSFTSIDFMGVLNKIINHDRVNSFIIALPDSMTSLGGNQYLNSIAVGNYEDYIVNDVMGYLKTRYGIRNTGLFGKSSGGFGAYNLTIRNPEKFQGFIDVSGDCGFEYSYIRDFPDAIRMIRNNGLSEIIRQFKEKDFHTMAELNTMNIIAMAAFYSPDNGEERKISLPFNVNTGEIKSNIWFRWKAYDPLVNVYDHFEKLREKKIILQTGKNDEFSLNLGIEGLSKILLTHSVDHVSQTYEGGHFGIDYLYLDSIPELISYLREF